MAEIIDVTYTASDSTVFHLQAEKLTRIKTANFHNWTYEPETMDRRFGGRVIGWKKFPAAYQTQLYFGGAIEDRKELIDRFHTKIERDIRALKPGRVQWLNWYIDCYIRSSSTYPDDSGYTVNDIEIYVPHPFWIKARDYSFARQERDPASEEWLDYPIGYEYDYTPEPVGTGTIVNESPGGADFKIVFYGPVVAPEVIIDGIRRAVDVVADEGDNVVIDSRDRTVILNRENGDKMNAFGYRSKDQPIFTEIPEGPSQLSWSGTFAFDLTIYEERSEPSWT